MNDYIYYEDIPKKERKELIKEEFKKHTSVRLWNALVGGFSVFMALTVSRAYFQDEAGSPIRLIVSIPVTIGLILLFHQAVVQPKIIRLVEKRKNS